MVLSLLDHSNRVNNIMLSMQAHWLSVLKAFLFIPTVLKGPKRYMKEIQMKVDVNL